MATVTGELKAKAQRLRRQCMDTITDHPHGDLRWEQDAVDVLDACLAMCPDDDSEPVDEAWLLANGFRPGKLPCFLGVDGLGEGGEISIGVTLPPEGVEEADCLWVQGEMVHVSPTRGEVRRLLAALRTDEQE